MLKNYSRYVFRHSFAALRLTVMCAFLLCCPRFSIPLYADAIDSLEQLLRSKPQIQEKVYVHPDNSCYFIGDTIWYKAYVLRADDHRPTDMSKLLYVELLSPDGLVVERQRIVVSDQGYTCGQFALPDSLYSGYYELRAYTRWMLNFNVSHRTYTVDDRRRFYNNQMAADFYRDWEGLYSRVLPVYSKPKVVGDYEGKYMYARPKMEMEWIPKKAISCTFYPEGGLLVEGLKSRVAFEVTDQDGKAVDISGTLDGTHAVATTYMGRGIFEYTPIGRAHGKVAFRWNGADYTFRLPAAQESGAVLACLQQPGADGRLAVTIQGRGCVPAAYAILCRGRLCGMQRLGGASTITIDTSMLPSGVNELQLYDARGQVLADRLFFVDHGDRGMAVEAATDKTDYAPYEPIALTIKAESSASNVPVSVSVYDSSTDDTSYDNGNILTDMLLSSDLKGFIASPAYYFESRDSTHLKALDLLMLVQGWRRYATFSKPRGAMGWGYLAMPQLRYEPEKTMTFEGVVNRQLDVPILQLTDVGGLNSIPSVAERGLEHAENAVTVGNIGQYSMDTDSGEPGAQSGKEPSGTDGPTVDDAVGEPEHGVNHRALDREVIVEAEIAKDGEVAGVVQKTHNGGRFSFQLPPFYDAAVLFVTAYEEKDSARYALTSRQDEHRMDEEWYPEFYVKRDLFYPVFSKPYSYYQTHLPDLLLPTERAGSDSIAGLLADSHTLGTVKVKGRRRSRRPTDFTKPAYVVDAYELYNEATDRGLSWGMANMGTFPPIACITVYGNMNRRRDYNVLGKLDRYTFYQNFSSTIDAPKNRSLTSVFSDLHLRRIRNFRFYTDYEPRNYAAPHTEQLNMEDVTVVYELIPDQGKRFTYRDRRYILPGISYPEQCYNPDYSKRIPEEPTDYRRTLYWNPNAKLDANGEFKATAYNNGRETRVKVSVAGVLPDGRFLVQH